ncbi:glycosyltransferase family 4 protein [Calothrix sp. FACHB-1219]|uniref:glycosyltransferase family 4 protein n=1 Tax=unclassified Calothrix TaxID=2619626 RepID=UPI0016854A5F|nr:MULTISPECIES: glycosyltransferase family 4 protein [unclassified Calothrix]MBD2201091.1 glycosyltransferase family 4 protein [Calothrix sp. FACHB-168]MBD2215524.1 glycosyltransferase family 4 protein [Calothrix sp. FACHB-1219]
MSKAKVSLVVSDFAGGGTVRAFLLAQILKKINYEVEVVGFLFGKEIYATPPSGIPINYVIGKNYPKFLLSAKTLLQKLDGDIIYAVKPKPTSFGVSLIHQLSRHRPLFLDMDDWELSWHGGLEWKYNPSLKQLYRDIFKLNGALKFPDHPLYLQWIERLVPKADVVTIDTNFLQKRFGGVYIPNGKDTAMFDPQKYNPEASRERYGLSKYRILMFPGAPRPHKGVEDVLLALDLLNEADLRLVIVGGSPYDDYDDQLIQKWGRWIIKLPKCPVEVMPEVVAAAHIIVVPQRDTITAQSQFPLKLTDGMAMAKPVLSTRVGDIPEILDDTGYLVDPGCPEQIAEQIQLIFKNLAAANEKGLKARARCVQKYSLETMSSTLAEVINRF